MCRDLKVSKPKRYSLSKLRLVHAPLKRLIQTHPHMSTSQCGNICIMPPKCSRKERRRSFHSCQVRVLYATLGFFFCKVVGENPWSQVAGFWAYLKKYGCLLGKSDKRLSPYSPTHRLTLCLFAVNGNQCNNISAVGNLPYVPLPHWRKITFKKKTRDAVIQAMIEVDVEEWDEFLLA